MNQFKADKALYFRDSLFLKDSRRYDSVFHGLEHSVLRWNHDRAVQIGNILFLLFNATFDYQSFGSLPKYR